MTNPNDRATEALILNGLPNTDIRRDCGIFGFSGFCFLHKGWTIE